MSDFVTNRTGSVTTSVTLLGTGYPSPDPLRRGPSQVLTTDSGLIVVDAGAGSLHRFIEAGFALSDIQRIALTHLHSDHITGLASILWAGWIHEKWSRPLALIGPAGTREFVENLLDAFSYDIRQRTAEFGLDRALLEPDVTEVTDGARFETLDSRLTAFRVDHGPVDQAFGYRLDSSGGSIVISGDTRRSDNLIAHARGADLLVHEVIWRTGMERRIAGAPEERRARLRLVLSYHTPADEVGHVAAQAGVGHLILSHLILAGGTINDVVGDARLGWHGQLTIGEDLMTFKVAER